LSPFKHRHDKWQTCQDSRDGASSLGYTSTVGLEPDVMNARLFDSRALVVVLQLVHVSGHKHAVPTLRHIRDQLKIRLAFPVDLLHMIDGMAGQHGAERGKGGLRDLFVE